MSNSYRIRTTPGVDKSIKVRIDQEFEYLEILSLKVLQSDIYTRQCADYGVIIGRVSINNGFGVPNAKISVFIPLSSDDEINNPIIAELYPYKTLTQTNDGGYRYNLLPSEQSYSNHVPTGSFFTRQDVLTNPTKIEIYDKYYKYNTVTNESGDYMIFGVPLGTQTIVVNVDLSDIGEFSLSPQDLIRMGAATPQQVNGTKFKSSSNLNELPQIITITRTLEVQPFWGDENLCVLGITRTDFDLSAEKNITIQPTAIFMGSLISSNDDESLKRKCKPTLKSGQLCNLISGPGQILAIRQTIFTDVNGRPRLEVADFEEGGQVIDDNGTWMFDVPMNLDYVVTNEFGEQVISKDPKKGIPTKGKYRFKINWNQSPDLGERVKRASFLVPNVKEYGWSTSDGTDPLTGKNAGSRGDFGNLDNPCSFTPPPNNDNYKSARASYAFSLDWTDYGVKDSGGVLTPLGDQMVLDAINCEDRFYEMQYNKVYTVSQLISEYRKGVFNNRIIAIKHILDEECETTNNQFPSNDGMYRLDIIFLLFQVLMLIAYPILFVIITIYHILLWIICKIILPIISFVRWFICWLAGLKVDVITTYIYPFGGLSDECDMLVALEESLKGKCATSALKLPNLTYPDCELCSCEPSAPTVAPPDPNSPIQVPNSANSDIITQGAYPVGPYGANKFSRVNVNAANFIVGIGVDNGYSDDSKGPSSCLTPRSGSESGKMRVASTDLPWHERFNLFNTKAKYFNNSTTNPGGGVNRIAVRFNTTMNGGDLPTGDYQTPIGLHHLDNVIAVIVDSGSTNDFKVGQLLTTVDPLKTSDLNLTGANFTLNDFGTNSITGKTMGTPMPGTQNKVSRRTQVPVYYANPDGSGTNLEVKYDLSAVTEVSYHKFAIDMEYFQVIHNVSLKTYVDDVKALGPNLGNSFFSRVINGGFQYVYTKYFDTYPLGYKGWYYFSTGGSGYKTFPPNVEYPDTCAGSESDCIGPIRNYFKGSDAQRVIFMVRGVDPNSPKTDISYDLSKLYGQQNYGKKVVTLPKMRMNIPVQKGYTNVKHNVLNGSQADSYSNISLFHDTFMWQPSFGTLQVGPGLDESQDPPVTYNPATDDPFYRPAGYCDFSSFTTTNHFYYSCIDGAGTVSLLGYGSNGAVYATAQKGLYINGPRLDVINGDTNALTCYYSKQSDYRFSADNSVQDTDTRGVVPFQNDPASDNGGYTNLSAKSNRGYFNGEIIEGGNYALSDPNPISYNLKVYYEPIAGYGNQTDCENAGYTWWGNVSTTQYVTCVAAGFGLIPCMTCLQKKSYYEISLPNRTNQDKGGCVIAGVRYFSHSYKSVSYTTPLKIDGGTSKRQIVMRSDRLPTSSFEEINKSINSISYTLMSNNNFTYYQISDDGSVNPVGSDSTVSGVGSSADSKADNAESKCENDVLGTFSCETLIPLDCYYYDVANDTISFHPRPKGALPTSGPGSCYGNKVPNNSNPVFGNPQPEAIFEGGCYYTVTVPLDTYLLDVFTLLPEWRARMTISFAACRNVFAHYFTNNWINGTLYSFSFINSRRFTNPSKNPKTSNKPYNCYCKNNIYFDTITNNFYYRSSPYSETDGFVGRKNPINWFTNNSYGGNTNNLMYPTTVMDLGPRDIYTQEIVYSNDYDGYVMKNLNSTTFKDISDLLNTFIISRLVNRGTLDKILAAAGVGSVLRYFSRENFKIDADYAQMVSINSELGTLGFSDESYSSCTDLFYNGGKTSNAVFGVFYSANTQVRDYVSPKRTIISDELTIDKTNCAFEPFKVKTQNVPYYQWFIKPNYGVDGDYDSSKPLFAPFKADSIFGSQLNGWSTEPYSGLTFFNYPYQKLDRLNRNSRYFRTKGSTITKYYRSFIYSVDSTGYRSANWNTWDVNNAPSDKPQMQRVVNTGAPYYFYFGLNQGKSAFDRFTRKWIEPEIITD